MSNKLSFMSIKIHLCLSKYKNYVKKTILKIKLSIYLDGNNYLINKYFRKLKN